MFIKKSEIKYVEFSRVDLNRSSNWRSFDIEIVRMKEDQKLSFLGIDKDEYQILVNYFRAKEIKMRIFDNVTHEHMEMEDVQGGAFA
jgi:hypothetical protein